MKVPMVIAIEGIDGSGKSSLAERLVSHLVSMGFQATIVRRFKRPEFDSIASIFNDSAAMSPDVLAALQASCAQVEISSWTAKEGLIVLDRSPYSMYASCVLRGASKELMLRLIALEPKPDITIFLRSSPDICFDRVMKRGGVRFYECGLDRLFRGRINFGRETFSKKNLTVDLMRHVFIQTMSEWNDLLAEVIPLSNQILIDDFDLRNSSTLIDQVLHKAEIRA